MDIIISNSSNDPIYEQIAKQIKNLIFNGELSEGEPLPSIRSLSKELKISVITTKKAYEKLENEGFIDTVAGKGSYIAGQNKEILRENRIKVIEEKLTEAVEASKLVNLPLKDLQQILEIIYNNQ